MHIITAYINACQELTISQDLLTKAERAVDQKQTNLTKAEDTIKTFVGKDKSRKVFKIPENLNSVLIVEYLNEHTTDIEILDLD